MIHQKVGRSSSVRSCQVACACTRVVEWLEMHGYFRYSISLSISLCLCPSLGLQLQEPAQRHAWYCRHASKRQLGARQVRDDMKQVSRVQVLRFRNAHIGTRDFRVGDLRDALHEPIGIDELRSIQRCRRCVKMTPQLQAQATEGRGEEVRKINGSNAGFED